MKRCISTIESKDWTRLLCNSNERSLRENSLPGRYFLERYPIMSHTNKTGYGIHQYVKFEFPESITFYKLMNSEDFP